MKRITVSVTTLACVFALAAAMSAAAAPRSGGGSTTKGSAKDWFLQTLLLVEDGANLYTDDRSGVIGRLEGALEGKDQHDIPAFANVNGSPGAVVLTHGAEWGVAAGQYLSDYRPSGSDRRVWTLAVTSNRPNASITLYWDGLNEITPKPEGGFTWQLNNASSALKTLRLVDLETGAVIPALGKKGVLNSYTFEMNGAGERLFRWVQGDVLPGDLVLSSASSLRAFSPLEPVVHSEAAPAAQGVASGLPAPPSVGTSAMPAEQPAPPTSVKLREK